MPWNKNKIGTQKLRILTLFLTGQSFTSRNSEFISHNALFYFFFIYIFKVIIQPKFSHVKNKYDLTLCQSCLHTASETFVHHKQIRIRFDFLRFRIRSMHLDRKG